MNAYKFLGRGREVRAESRFSFNSMDTFPIGTILHQEFWLCKADIAARAENGFAVGRTDQIGMKINVS